MRSAAATTSTGDDLPDLGAVKIPLGSRSVASCVASGLSGFGQQLLEQRERPRVAGLAEPEQRLAPHRRLGVGARDANEGGDTRLARLLRQGEYRLLLHVPVHVGIVYQVGELLSRRFARGLTEPEHRLMTSAPGRAIVTGQLQEHRPDDDRIRERRGQYRLLAGARVFAGGETEQEVHRLARRRCAEVGDGRIPRRGDPAPSHVGAERLYPAGPDGERDTHRSRLAIVLDLIVVEAVVERDRASPSSPPALPAGALQRDDVVSVAAHPGTGGEAQPDGAVGCGGDPGAEALGEDRKSVV